jgi:hypothetical protein
MTRRRSALASSVAILALSAVSARAEAPRDHKLGFVMTSMYTAIYQTPYMEECPGGLTMSNDELWWRSLDRKERDRITKGGDEEPISEVRRSVAAVRGPGGKDVCWNPTSVKDPPMTVVEGKTSFGMNLDGNTDGKATPNTCAHGNFTGTDGTAGVDNQVYRLLGCTFGWRSSGYMENNASTERRDSSHGILLIEVTNVDDAMNDDDVTVGYYRNLDALPKDSKGQILPNGSYRADSSGRYSATTKGRIVNGVLTADPVDAHLPFLGTGVERYMFIKGLRLQLDVTSGGEREKKGMIAGYHDLENWWGYMQRIGSGYAVTMQASCPALREATEKYADGYPDPKTGKCTALSSAYNLTMVPAFVIHPPQQSASR